MSKSHGLGEAEVINKLSMPYSTQECKAALNIHVNCTFPLVAKWLRLSSFSFSFFKSFPLIRTKSNPAVKQGGYVECEALYRKAIKLIFCLNIFRRFQTHLGLGRVRIDSKNLDFAKELSRLVNMTQWKIRKTKLPTIICKTILHQNYRTYANFWWGSLL